MVLWGKRGMYEGQMRDGEAEGTGTFTLPNGSSYVGEWKNDLRHGKGVTVGANGGKYEGEFKDGYVNGQGVDVYADGSKYEGEFKDGNYHGQGILRDAAGRVLQQGVWVNDILVQSMVVALHTPPPVRPTAATATLFFADPLPPTLPPEVDDAKVLELESQLDNMKLRVAAAESKAKKAKSEAKKAHLKTGKAEFEAEKAKSEAEQAHLKARKAESESERAKSEAEEASVRETFRRSLVNTYPTLIYEVLAVRKLHPPAALEASYGHFHQALSAAGHRPQERAVRLVFHTCRPETVDDIEREGMRPADCDVCLGRVPWIEHDNGFFGDHSQGVYVSKHADYTFFYQYGRPPKAGDEGVVMMLETVTGRIRQFDRREYGAQPTHGYESHESSNHLENYLWDSSTRRQRPCGRVVPRWAIRWRALQNNRMGLVHDQ